MNEPNEYLHSLETHFYGDGCDEAHGSWVNMEQSIAAWRALADEGAAAINKWLSHVDDNDIMRSIEAMEGIKRWLARYREARQQ